MRPQRWFLASALAVGTVIASGLPATGYGLGEPATDVTLTASPRDATWKPSAKMAHRRAEPMIVRLKNGNVLVAGSGDSSMSTLPCKASVEIYHPARNHWTSAAPLPRPLCGANAIVLHDGHVLVAGGFVTTGHEAHVTRATWLYRPGRDDWSRTGNLRRGRAYFAMAPLPGGRVLVAGGRTTPGEGTLRRSTEIYHPRTGKWHQTDPLEHRRAAQSAVVLEDRDILVAGGYTRTAERFDVRRQRWVPAGELREWVLIDPSLVTQRGGNVLAIGDGAKVDQFRTDHNTWRPFTPLPLRVQGESALRFDHRPLVIGGLSRDDFSARCFGWHPKAHAWAVDSTMPVPKQLFGAIRFGRGAVMVAGGEVRHVEGTSYYTRSTATLRAR